MEDQMINDLTTSPGNNASRTADGSKRSSDQNDAKGKTKETF